MQENKEKDKAKKEKREFRERKLWGLIIGGHLCEIYVKLISKTVFFLFFCFCLCVRVIKFEARVRHTYQRSQFIVEFGGGLIPYLLTFALNLFLSALLLNFKPNPPWAKLESFQNLKLDRVKPLLDDFNQPTR